MDGAQRVAFNPTRLRTGKRSQDTFGARYGIGKLEGRYGFALDGSTWRRYAYEIRSFDT